MRVPTVVLFLGSACLLSANLASGQPSEGVPAKSSLAARMVVDEHEHCFTVRFFLKNDSDRDVEVTYGRGGSGLQVVPVFRLGGSGDVYITPPTYLRPASRALRPDVMPIPAGKEILYGTFTMGYPRSRDVSNDEISATIQFQEPKLTLRTKPVRLKIPAQKSDTAAVVATIDSPKAPDLPGAWVNSDNGDLSLRLRFKSALLATQDSIFVIAEIRNNTARPVTILRPFGDPYPAEAGQIKIWGEQGRIEYIGPVPDYDLNKTSFITLEAKEIAADTLELPVRNFAETGKAGSYAVRYDYSYRGTWDEIVAKQGVKGIWHGAICSREIQLKKLEGVAQAPRPSQEQLNADLRKLLPLAGILNEKPDDATARQEAAGLAIRLAPHLPGNRMVWEVLIKMRTLKDGMSLPDAEELLGSPARKSEKFVVWYAHPDSKHVTPYLRANVQKLRANVQATVQKDGLAEWTLTNQ